jgi:hypothetical protein
MHVQKHVAIASLTLKEVLMIHAMISQLPTSHLLVIVILSSIVNFFEMMKRSARCIVVTLPSLMHVVKHVGCVVKTVRPSNSNPKEMEKRGAVNGLQKIMEVIPAQKSIAMQDIIVPL